MMEIGIVNFAPIRRRFSVRCVGRDSNFISFDLGCSKARTEALKRPHTYAGVSSNSPSSTLQRGARRPHPDGALLMKTVDATPSSAGRFD